MTTISKNYANLIEEVRIATKKADRADAEVKMVVVTKGHTQEKVLEAINAGAVDLGENYVQEAVAKIESMGVHSDVTWHMIGHVQSRKAAIVVKKFPWIQSVDSLKLARRLDRFAGEAGLRPSILLEYNVSGEGTKFGWDASDLGGWPDLTGDAENILSLPNLNVCGLMTMAPYLSDPEQARPFFVKLRKLSEFLADRFGDEYFHQLSMGMSQDFNVAIQEGATIIRVGQAIMGPRPAPPGRV